jgi:SAM-dependent methyltransferase
MSHIQQMNFVGSVKQLYSKYFFHTKIAEVGSLNINGSVRDFFIFPKQYVGCDLGPGPGVDMVCPGHELPFDDNHFDVAISCECFEHDQHWAKTFAKMIALVHDDGLVVFSCATTGRPEHGTHGHGANEAPFTNDYYRNLTEQDFREQFDFGHLFKEHAFLTNEESHDLYFVGVVKK